MNGVQVLLRLIVLVKPLVPVMMCTITAGVLGFLCAIFITVLGCFGILNLMDLQESVTYRVAIGLILVCAVCRSILRYLEQSTGHYIAFKILATIRDHVFRALRRLSPAKLECKEKGNLISIITSDIELLEVFYAHTIAPISIAILTSAIMVYFISRYSSELALIALFAYIVIGFILPVISSNAGRQRGRDFRNNFGQMNSYLLDNLRGLRETMQYNNGKERLERMDALIDGLEYDEQALKIQNGVTQGATDSVILMFSLAMIVAGIHLMNLGKITFVDVVIATVSLMSSFGPVAALSALSGSLNHTIASGERVLSILDESPQVKEITNGTDVSNKDNMKVDVNDVTFSYTDETILDNISLNFGKNELIGICGKSGSGKSTLLKLIMRFWDVQKGSISVNSNDVRKVNTSSLRDVESYVTQETSLFNDSIEENIKVAKLDATHEEVVAAAKKASIHDFIESLPEGYQTNVGELGDRLSGGERQRIGIARAFLHDSNLILLDEPTSNLDSLNEAIILKSINNARKDKAIVLVSHRLSTMSAADKTYSVEHGRLS